MKTPKEIRERILKLQKDYKPVLTGSMATVDVNAPRAMSQICAETTLQTLHWVLGEEFKSKLKGVNL